jgi:hypothetical protein
MGHACAVDWAYGGSDGRFRSAALGDTDGTLCLPPSHLALGFHTSRDGARAQVVDFEGGRDLAIPGATLLQALSIFQVDAGTLHVRL